MRKYHNAETRRTPYEVRLNELLLDWDISPGERAVVIGGYDGATCDYILERFPEVDLFTFEPQPAFYGPLAARFADEPNVHVFPFALGDRDGTFPMVRQGGMFSSFITDQYAQIEPARPNGVGQMREWGAVMSELGIDRLAWFHANIEAYEYVLLPHLIRTGWIERIGQMVIATHGMPERHPDAWSWDEICGGLAKTHQTMWNEMGWWAFERGGV